VPLKSTKVAERVTEAINVVNPQTCHQARFDQSHDDGMFGLEHQGVLDADTYQVSDGKEAPIVDFGIDRQPVRHRSFGDRRGWTAPAVLAGVRLGLRDRLASLVRPVRRCGLPGCRGTTAKASEIPPFPQIRHQ